MRLTPAVKNILWLTIGFFILQTVVGERVDLILGLHYWSAPGFRLWQPLTYMLMHANFNHIFCNLLAVWCFGPAIEQYLGTRRFYWFYILSGVGAAFVQEVMWTIQLTSMAEATYYAQHMLTIGASGAVFGILLAFGWFFPDERIFLLFIPIPIRSRIFVSLYALFELFAGVHSTDNVAHFAHLGGMLFGWLILLYWRQHPTPMRDEPTIFKRLANWWKQRVQQAKAPKQQSTFHYQSRVNTNTDTNTDTDTKKQRSPEIDRILDKIKASGYGSLTDEEKRQLFENQ